MHFGCQRSSKVFGLPLIKIHWLNIAAERPSHVRHLHTMAACDCKKNESDDLYSSVYYVFIPLLPHLPPGLLSEELYKGLQNDGAESSYLE